MHGRKVPERVLALHLHDVDLATRGPSNLTDVGAQRPEGGPYAAALRRLDASFNPRVYAKGVVSAGIHPRRRVLTATKILAPRFDDQHPIFNPRVLRPIGVVLELVVTKPAVAQ